MLLEILRGFEDCWKSRRSRNCTNPPRVEPTLVYNRFNARFFANFRPQGSALFSFSSDALGAISSSDNVAGCAPRPRGKPVGGATVDLRALSGPLQYSAQTSSNGEFHFQDIKMGVYRVAVAVAGRSYTAKVTITSSAAPVSSC